MGIAGFEIKRHRLAVKIAIVFLHLAVSTKTTTTFYNSLSYTTLFLKKGLTFLNIFLFPCLMEVYLFWKKTASPALDISLAILWNLVLRHDFSETNGAFCFHPTQFQPQKFDFQPQSCLDWKT